MKLVSIVAALALIEYAVFFILAGQARGRYGVAAPATTGHPIFERYFRVQKQHRRAAGDLPPGALHVRVFRE